MLKTAKNVFIGVTSGIGVLMVGLVTAVMLVSPSEDSPNIRQPVSLEDGESVLDARSYAQEKTNVLLQEPEAIAPTPMTDAEKYKQALVSATPGILAADTLSKLDAASLYQNTYPALCMSLDANDPLDQVHQAISDTFRVSLAVDEKLASNMATGVIDGTIKYGCL